MEVDLRTMAFSVLLLMLWSLQTCLAMISDAGSIEFNGGSEETDHKTLFDKSFWYSFSIGYVCSAFYVLLCPLGATKEEQEKVHVFQRW